MIRLLEMYDGNGAPRLHAMEYLYEIMKEREQDPGINISHKGLPSWTQHQAFVLSKPYRYWYLIDHLEPGGRGDRLWVGYISATHNNEIGIVLQRHARGKGLGPMAIRMFVANHKPVPESSSVRSGNWLANISPSNEHSKKVFTKLGFRLIQHTFSLPAHTDS